MKISKKRVFVSGCFDLLHSGHIKFLENASKYGVLTVAIGSDKTIAALKGKAPLVREDERLAMVRAIRWVDYAFVSRGVGELDFQEDLTLASPHIFVVNQDGDSPDKRELCGKLGVEEYKVLPRIPSDGLPPRSTSVMRQLVSQPYRLDLAGGWLDQSWVSKLNAGPVVVASLEPSHEYNERSGMATSTRSTALDLWGPRLPAGDPEALAKSLFCCENPPGSKYISGSQDAIGLVYPGVSRLDYEGDYWPSRITSVLDEDLIRFVEYHTSVIPLSPRALTYSPKSTSSLTKGKVKALAGASNACWDALLHQDISRYAKAVQQSFDAQVSLFPDMITPEIQQAMDLYPNALGFKIAGAGGGGYLVVIHKEHVEGSMQLRVRRSDY